MKFIVLFVLFILQSSCIDFIGEYNEIHNKVNIVTCKHPDGRLITYNISNSEANYPHNMKGGLWKFKTLKGKKVISSLCHLERE